MNDSNISTIDSNSCLKLSDTKSPFMLVIHQGQDISETILSCAQKLKLKSAYLSGLGALENPCIAYFNLATQKYQNETFPGIYELISLHGNLGEADGELVLHIHVALGDDQHRVIGGHLQNAKVGVTAEILVMPLKGPLLRKFNPALGIKTISAED